MTDEPMSVFLCGPQTQTCACDCAQGGECEHQWDGPYVEIENGGSVTCSRCGGAALYHDMWVGP